jgi:thymidylate kinase
LLITLEGCDGTGKSTLAESLADIAGSNGIVVRMLHRGKPTHDDAFDEYELELLDYRPTNNELVICDRWHWCEAIYGPKYRGRSMLDDAGLRHIDLFLRARGAVQVLLDMPPVIVQQRLAQRGDDMVEVNDVPGIMDKYCVLAANVGRHVVWQDPNDRHAAESLFVMATLAGEQACDLPVTETYVGPCSPELLLVGETRGTGPARRDNLPAFVPRAATSGHYLLTTLERADVPPTYGLVNALEDDVPALWHVLGHPHVVALGITAHHELERGRVPHGWVPHPQYVRRFHNKRSEDYARMILTAATERRRVWLA